MSIENRMILIIIPFVIRIYAFEVRIFLFEIKKIQIILFLIILFVLCGNGMKNNEKI